MWLTGNALRLLERTKPGVLHTDLAACDRYGAGQESAARVRCPTLVIVGERDIMAPPKNAQGLIDCAARRARSSRFRSAGMR